MKDFFIRIYQNPWIPIAIIISSFIGVMGIMQVEAQTIAEKQRIRKAGMETFQPKTDITTTTKGYISVPSYNPITNPYAIPQSGYINLKTRQTASGSVTTGYINGRHVRIVEKKK